MQHKSQHTAANKITNQENEGSQFEGQGRNNILSDQAYRTTQVAVTDGTMMVG
jgi:hypothetical protein